MADAENDDNNSIHSGSNKGNKETKDDRLAENSRSERSSSNDKDNEVRREVNKHNMLFECHLCHTVTHQFSS